MTYGGPDGVLQDAGEDLLSPEYRIDYTILLTQDLNRMNVYRIRHRTNKSYREQKIT